MAKSIKKNPKKAEVNKNYDEIIVTFNIPVRMTDVARIAGDKKLMEDAMSVHDQETAAKFIKETKRTLKDNLPVFSEEDLDLVSIEEIESKAAEALYNAYRSTGFNFAGVAPEELDEYVSNVVHGIIRTFCDSVIKVTIDGRKNRTSHALVTFKTPEAEERVEGIIKKSFYKAVDLLKATEESQPEE